MWGARRTGSHEASWTLRRGIRLTYWLVGGLIACHLLLRVLQEATQATAPDLVGGWLAVSAEGLRSGRLWQLVTYQLLHRDAWHLAFDMLFLFFVGQIFESLAGKARLVGVLFGCGAAAGLAAFPEGDRIVGISGGLMGLLVVLALAHPDLLVNLFFFPIRLKWIALVIVGVDILLLASPESEVSHWSHLFGAASGVGYALLWPRIVGPWVGDLRRRRAHRREIERIERSLNEERELDRILEKIAEQGMEKLTEEERRFLEKASRRYQESRRD